MPLFRQYPFARLFSAVFAVIVFLSISVSAKSDQIESDQTLRQETFQNIARDETLGEDLEIRRVAREALGSAAGTVVVMDAQTGRIYTIVNQDWGIREAFKPCSTIKLVTGVAGYSENLIRPNGNLQIGAYRLGLDDALAFSNNAYFQKVGANLGSEKLISYARRLGLGEKTGINAENETAGRLPYGNENPRIYSHADDFRTSPLQLAVMVSALTNGGKLLIPRIPRSSREKISFNGFWQREIGLASSIYKRVIPGMIGAVDRGTARRMEKSSMSIGGKTGSCIADRTWVGLFASVAPVENPRFAVVVITKGQYARGKHSAAIAGKIYEALAPRLAQRFHGTIARLSVKSFPESNPNQALGGEFKSARQNQPNALKSSQAEKTDKIAALKNPPDSAGGEDKAGEEEIAPEPIKELFPTIVINGKAEITRPRVVQKQQR